MKDTTSSGDPSQHDPSPPARPGMSRRAFLRGSLLAVGGVGLAQIVACAPAPAPAVKPTAAPAAAKAAPTAAPQAAPGGAMKAVTMAATPGGQGNLLTAIAQGEKLDQKHGLQIEYKAMPLANLQAALMSDAVDAGYFTPIPMANLVLEGHDVVAYGPWGLSHVAWMVKPDSPYQSLADLKGKKISATAKTTSSYTHSQILAREQGLNWEKDFQVIIAEALPQVGFLEKGDVEMISLFEPFVSRQVVGGTARVLAYQQDLFQQKHNKPLVNSHLGGKREWVEKNRELARAVNQVFSEANEFATKPETYEKYKDVIKPESDRELELLKENFVRFFSPKWDENVVESLNYQIKLAAELGILPRVPDKEIFLIP